MKQKVHFPSSKGHQLYGVLSDPLGDVYRPMIVLCHGLSTSKDGRTCVRLEEIFNRNGFSTFRFDFFGHGESEGDFANVTISEAVDDVQCAIQFVKDKGYERIGLVGSSFGGMASILFAGQSEDLFALALKSPVSDYLALLIARDHGQDIEAWKQKGCIFITAPDGKNERLNYSFFADAQKIRGYALAANIKAPTFIVHGDKDITVPLAQSQKIAKVIPECKLEVVKGADHVYSDPEHFEIMLRCISDFIILKGKSQSE
jgi:pimeloyl-ACP methyl ester carboxylesterase